jgi:sulfur-carrier protein
VATVRIPESLARLFFGAERRYEIDEPTVLALIDALDRLHLGMRDRLCDGRPEIRRHINIFVDGEKAGLSTRLTEKSEVDIIPAASGG